MQEDLRGAESLYAGLPGFESQRRAQSAPVIGLCCSGVNMQTPPSNPFAPPVSGEAAGVDDQAWLLRAILGELMELNAQMRGNCRASSGYAIMAHRGEAVLTEAS